MACFSSLPHRPSKSRSPKRDPGPPFPLPCHSPLAKKHSWIEDGYFWYSCIGDDCVCFAERQIRYFFRSSNIQISHFCNSQIRVFMSKVCKATNQSDACQCCVSWKQSSYRQARTVFFYLCLKHRQIFRGGHRHLQIGESVWPERTGSDS